MSYVRIRHRTSGYDIVRQDTMSYVRIRCRTSGYDVVRQDTMSYDDIRHRMLIYDVVYDVNKTLAVLHASETAGEMKSKPHSTES
jgi:hypothetical protein